MNTATRPCIEDWEWAQTLVRFDVQIPAESHVQSVRILAMEGDALLVCDDVNGNRFVPGGNLEPGESILECAKRELIEEAGYRADSITWVGAHHGLSYSEGPFRQHSPFPYKAWVWGFAGGMRVCDPTSPAGSEQIAAVTSVPIAAVEELFATTIPSARMPWAAAAQLITGGKGNPEWP